MNHDEQRVMLTTHQKVKEAIMAVPRRKEFVGVDMNNMAMQSVLMPDWDGMAAAALASLRRMTEREFRALLFNTIQEQSQGEWDDQMILKDVELFYSKLIATGCVNVKGE